MAGEVANLTLEQLQQIIKDVISTNVEISTYITPEEIYPKMIIELKWNGELISTTYPS